FIEALQPSYCQTDVVRSAFYSVLLSVQIIAFSFVALKIVVCFSFGSSENFHLMFVRFSAFKISANSFVKGETSSAFEPANQIRFSVMGKFAKCSFAVLTK